MVVPVVYTFLSERVKESETAEEDEVEERAAAQA
jgi:hypothetical protein